VSALLSLVAVPMAHAEGTMSFGLNGGVAMPMGDFGDAFKLGFAGGVYGDYWMNSKVAIGADVMYNRFTGDEDVFGSGSDITFSDIQFGGHLKYKFPMEGSSMAPWLQGGVAAYNGKADGSGVDGDSSTDFGFNVGAGLGFWSNPSMGLGVVGLFHDVMTEGESTQYINVGLNLTFSTTGSTSMDSK
jgi:Outer membrane protein beta-barrel domain